MRGSVYYQSAVLTKVIFTHGAKKEEKTDCNHEYFNGVSSYNTMQTYRSIWNNFFNYLKEHFKIKNFELIKAYHVEHYIEYKIEYYPSKQYLEKIVSALGKLEIALNKYSKAKYDTPIIYNFEIRSKLLKQAKDLKLIANNYKNRVYQNPNAIIELLSSKEHQLAATIQLEGGARSEGVTLIKKEQLKGIEIDKITKSKKAIIQTKEKGGKVGDVYVSKNTYALLNEYFEEHQTSMFKINYQNYVNDIRNACLLLNIEPKGSHGFRWTFAQNRVREYQKHGYSYAQALQGVSWEMKHYRASITEHYLGE